MKIQLIKRPKIKSVREAAERVVTRTVDTVALDDEDAVQWLEEANCIALARWRKDTGLQSPAGHAAMAPPSRETVRRQSQKASLRRKLAFDGIRRSHNC